MNLQSTIHNDINFVTVNAKRIDALVAVQFKDAIRAETETGPDHVVLDLCQVDFVDSSGLGAIVAAMKQLGKERQLDLAGLTPVVDKVFRLTRMDSVFVIHNDASSLTVKKTG